MGGEREEDDEDQDPRILSPDASFPPDLTGKKHELDQSNASPSSVLASRVASPLLGKSINHRGRAENSRHVTDTLCTSFGCEETVFW